MKRTPDNIEQFQFKQLEGSGKDADAYTDEDVMPFGRHKGVKLKDVPDSYLTWLFEQVWCKTDYPKLFAYIYNVYEALDAD